MKRNNSIFKFLGLTVAVLLPLSFYIIAKVLKKDQLQMPSYYHAESVDQATGDTIYHKVGDVRLVNQMGDTVQLNKQLSGKMLLVEVFFTSCGTVCPKLTNNISYFLHKAFQKNDTTVQFVSISIDPERDTVGALKAYAKTYHANPDHWWFLTGNGKDIYQYLSKELHLAVNEPNGGVEQLEHTPTLVLIDKDRYIRGYYNGLDTLALKTCADDIGLISMQKDNKIKKRKP